MGERRHRTLHLWSQTHPLKTKDTSRSPTLALPMTAVPRNMGPMGAGRVRGRAERGGTRDQSQRYPRERRAPKGRGETQRRVAGMEVKGRTESSGEGTPTSGLGEGGWVTETESKCKALSRKRLFPPDLSTDPYNLLSPR